MHLNNRSISAPSNHPSKFIWKHAHDVSVKSSELSMLIFTSNKLMNVRKVNFCEVKMIECIKRWVKLHETNERRGKNRTEINHVLYICYVDLKINANAIKRNKWHGNRSKMVEVEKKWEKWDRRQSLKVFFVRFFFFLFKLFYAGEV